MESLLIFAKPPVLGKVKTRLAQERGHHDAVVLYAAFLKDTLRLCQSWRRNKNGSDPNRRLVFCVADQIEDPFITEMARLGGAKLLRQAEGDLGERLANAFEHEFSRGARAVCAVGGDSPTMPVHLLEQAFRALLWERVVMGPTFDGGYWLIGAKRPAPEMFSNIPWSTPAVTMKTLSKLRQQKVESNLLPFWYDVDSAVDLEKLAWHLRAIRESDEDIGQATWGALQRIGIIRE